MPKHIPYNKYHLDKSYFCSPTKANDTFSNNFIPQISMNVLLKSPVKMTQSVSTFLEVTAVTVDLGTRDTTAISVSSINCVCHIKNIANITAGRIRKPNENNKIQSMKSETLHLVYIFMHRELISY